MTTVANLLGISVYSQALRKDSLSKDTFRFVHCFVHNNLFSNKRKKMTTFSVTNNKMKQLI